MADSRPGSTRPGPLGVLYGWFKRPAPPPSADQSLPARLGHYEITARLGQGGMGTVYAARDERLRRPVAIKTISLLGNDEKARQRFWREARAAASVNHPNVCQIYEIGEDAGELFIAMELLEGTALSARLADGPLSVSETVDLGVAMLSALSALHARGIVHRDLKPSNVFLTPQGLKLLDFGLARSSTEGAVDTVPDLTQPGTVAGTPRYMAPEQVLGQPLDARTDLFAAGAILFEMLSGRPPFNGRTVVEILHGTVYEHPPALAGPASVAAVDRVIRRALAKAPDDRPPSAEVMAADLRQAGLGSRDDIRGVAKALTRLVVLPFRLLRPDPEIDFLAFSLPDAITTSVSTCRSLIVRSGATAARFTGEVPDFKALAIEADVDRVVVGTVLRSNDQLRVSVQLVEAPSGTILASHAVQGTTDDLFALQDAVARRVVESVAGSTAEAPPATGSVSEAPPKASAYELYLRANDLARSYQTLTEARALYERCVELDPDYAPAWARLGRCRRVIGKFMAGEPDSDQRAEEALRRALELSPRLTIAHKFYANLEADTGRAIDAMRRLIAEATRHGTDPELFAGLVHACRYAGLYDESLAAHAEARRLDPNLATSVKETLLMVGDYDGVLGLDSRELDSGDYGIRAVAQAMAGRMDAARRELAAMKTGGVPIADVWRDHLHAWLERDTAGMIDHLDALGSFKIFDDPEASFQEAWLLCDVALFDRALPFLSRAIDRGYFPARALARASQFDAIRDRPAFQSIVADAEAGRERALRVFTDAGGDRLLRA